jgi:CheY-specific phosphatase CheX
MKAETSSELISRTAAPDPVEPWVDAAEESMREVSVVALGLEPEPRAKRLATTPPHLSGAYVQLISPLEVVQVGLCADAATLCRLAGALLGGEEDLPPADVADAVGEIVNMFAGGMKRRLVAERPGLQLGLPVFIHGHLEATRRQQLRVAQQRLLPELEVVLVVLREPRVG